VPQVTEGISISNVVSNPLFKDGTVEGAGPREESVPYFSLKRSLQLLAKFKSFRQQLQSYFDFKRDFLEKCLENFGTRDFLYQNGLCGRGYQADERLFRHPSSVPVLKYSDGVDPNPGFVQDVVDNYYSYVSVLDLCHLENRFSFRNIFLYSIVVNEQVQAGANQDISHRWQKEIAELVAGLSLKAGEGADASDELIVVPYFGKVLGDWPAVAKDSCYKGHATSKFCQRCAALYLQEILTAGGVMKKKNELSQEQKRELKKKAYCFSKREPIDHKAWHRLFDFAERNNFREPVQVADLTDEQLKGLGGLGKPDWWETGKFGTALKVCLPSIDGRLPLTFVFLSYDTAL